MLKYEVYKRMYPNISEDVVAQSYITYRNNGISLSNMGSGSVRSLEPEIPFICSGEGYGSFTLIGGNIFGSVKSSTGYITTRSS